MITKKMLKVLDIVAGGSTKEVGRRALFSLFIFLLSPSNQNFSRQWIFNLFWSSGHGIWNESLSIFLLGCYFKTNFGVYNVVYAIDSNKFGKLSLEYKTKFVNNALISDNLPFLDKGLIIRLATKHSYTLLKS